MFCGSVWMSEDLSVCSEWAPQWETHIFVYIFIYLYRLNLFPLLITCKQSLGNLTAQKYTGREGLGGGLCTQVGLSWVASPAHPTDDL